MKKKLFFIFICGIMILGITGCNSREEVEHLSQKDLIKYVEHNITEKTQFIENNTQDVDNYIYTFKLVYRNINFEVQDLIINQGLNLDGSQFYNDYKQSIVLKDYVISILNNLEQERLTILNKYNFTEKYYNYGAHVITVDDYNDLSNLSRYIVEIDNLYQFNIEDVETKNLGNVNLADVISFSKTESSIEGVSYSTSKKARLKYKKVYKILEEQYITLLKKFNLTDDTIPKDIWNKY